MNPIKLKKQMYALICIALFLAATMQAQKGIFGVRYMPTVSSIKVQNFEGDALTGEFIVGHGFGALLGVNLNKHIGIQAEAIYSQLSQKFKDDNLNRTIEINYVTVPVLLSINTNRERILNLNAVIGPQWGYNIGAELKTTGVPNGNGNSTAVLAVKQNDFGIAYGAGFDFALNTSKKLRLDIGFRGVMGLIEANNTSETIAPNSYYILQNSRINSYSGYIGLTILF